LRTGKKSIEIVERWDIGKPSSKGRDAPGDNPSCRNLLHYEKKVPAIRLCTKVRGRGGW